MKRAFLTCIVASALLAPALPAHAGPTAALRAPSQRVAATFVDQRRTPSEPLAFTAFPRAAMPVALGVDPRTYNLRKAYAAHNPFAPAVASNEEGIYPRNTPPASPKFKGMANSPTICPYFHGCQPPDMAIAASTTWVLQAVNTSIAVYSPTGVLQAGFPKNAQTFFGVPSPSPPGCDPNGPFLSDPRAFYDRIDGRFYVAMLQVENNFGVGNGCTPLSKIWIAVSQSNDPTAGWYVYNFNMDFSNANFALDFTQLGFDYRAVYFGGNMYAPASGPFQYDEVFFASKSVMEAGGSVTSNGFFNMTNGGRLDTLQPVQTQTTLAQQPRVEFLVGSENLNFGGGQCSSGCNGLDVYAISDPLGSPSLTGVRITMNRYVLAPQADQPGCTACVETLDTRITATPVYSAARGGVISFALETGVKNGTGTVPGVLWGEVQPIVSGGSVTGAVLVQSGIIKGPGDEADSFGATMASPDGSLWIVNDRMSSTIKPGIVYRVQRSTDPLGTLENKVALRGGAASTIDSRWGRYEATGLDDAGFVWLASQYSASSGNWATFIGRVI